MRDIVTAFEALLVPLLATGYTLFGGVDGFRAFRAFRHFGGNERHCDFG